MHVSFSLSGIMMSSLLLGIVLSFRTYWFTFTTRCEWFWYIYYYYYYWRHHCHYCRCCC